MKKIFKLVGISAGVLVLCILVFGFMLVRTGFKAVEQVPCDLPKQAATTWDQIFANPAPVSVVQFKTGEMQLDRYPDNPPRAEDRHKPTDVLAFGIKHERYGDLLIDTGFDHSFAGEGSLGNYPQVMKLFMRMSKNGRISQAQGQDIASWMAVHQIKPQRVYFTHLHADHAAGIPALPENIEYIFDVRELNFLGKAMLNYYLPGKRQLKTIDFSAAQEISPLGKCIDLLGDGSLWMVSTPGHSPGHASYVVNAKSGPVLITGDAAFYYWGFAHGMGAAFDHDKDGAHKSREQLRAFSKQYPQVKVFVGHEMARQQ